MDFAAAGLLDGLKDGERRARERLLEQLLEQGVPLEELKSAVAESRLALLPVERVLGGRHTAREIEQRTGLSAKVLVRMRRLQGLSEPDIDDRVFSDEDVQAAQSTQLFLKAGLSEDAIIEITRVLGEAMARLAATTAAAFVEAFLRPGDSEADVGLRFAALAEQLAPALDPVLSAAYQAHLRESVRRGMIGRAELQAGALDDAQQVTVCFADLVGFTRLGGEVEVQELGSVAGKLAGLATEVLTPSVRLVKTIGDAAMFVSRDPAPLVEAALSLVEAVQAAELPSLRAGIACGPALQRAGDFYGHTVNLSSRVTGIARPDSVLCTQEVHDDALEDFEWSFAGRHRLKGIPEPVPLYRARRRGQPESDEKPPDRAAKPAQDPRPAKDARPKKDPRAKKPTKRRADRSRKRASS